MTSVMGLQRYGPGIYLGCLCRVTVVAIVTTCPNRSDVPTKAGKTVIGTVPETPKKVASNVSGQFSNKAV